MRGQSYADVLYSLLRCSSAQGALGVEGKSVALGQETYLFERSICGPSLESSSV